MAITTFNQAISGVVLPELHWIKNVTTNIAASNFYSSYGASGWPVGFNGPTPGVAGVALTPIALLTTEQGVRQAGFRPFNTGTGLNTHIARFFAHRGNNVNNGAGMLCIADRIWHNSGLDRTLTTAQTVNSVTWPARDVNASTNGEGVMVGIEISTTMGTGVPSVTMSYTNQAGTAGRTATLLTNPVAASAAAGTLMPFNLQTGDTGVRSIQSVTFSASWGTAGVLHLVAYRILACIPINSFSSVARSSQENFDILSLGMPRVFDDAFLFFLAPSYSTNIITTPGGIMTFTQG